MICSAVPKVPVICPAPLNWPNEAGVLMDLSSESQNLNSLFFDKRRAAAASPHIDTLYFTGIKLNGLLFIDDHLKLGIKFADPRNIQSITTIDRYRFGFTHLSALIWQVISESGDPLRITSSLIVLKGNSFSPIHIYISTPV